ncbi:hypothetical protein [Mesobacillus thioparans]|uniref:hypothetical protein n=1 Tax=Mesobacillus thioparans TaxID=370439 RepID=UPI0039EFC824
MIKNKKYLILAIIFFSISAALNFPFPHEYPRGQEISVAFGFPINTMDGLSYIGVTGLLLFIISLFFLVKSLDQYHVRMVLIAMLLVVFLPMEMVNAYQNTLATGIYAIEYDRESSSCVFETKNKKTLTANCQFPFENHSNHPVRFNIEFYKKYLFEDDMPMLSLLNEGGPYEVILHGKERETVNIETEMELSRIGVDSISGDSSMINIKIVDGEKVRKL